jgi:two-component system NtrC family sensor kinase
MADPARTADSSRDHERELAQAEGAGSKQPSARAPEDRVRPVPRRRSIPGRIFAGFAVVLLAFGSLAAVSVWQHQRTAATLRLLDEGYLPLSLSISEARATQAAFATMVERALEGGETAAAEGWLEIARRIRPFALRRALDATAQAQRLVRYKRELKPLTSLHRALEAVLVEYELSEEDFDTLSSAVAARDRGLRSAALTNIRVREREAQQRLAEAWQLINERIAVTGQKARDDEQRAVGLLVGLGLLALAVTLAITFWSQRVLSPLTRLSERVAAVARGDLSARVERHADDELGRVAQEFERMVGALSERDDQLRRTERLVAMGKLAAHVTHEVRNPLNSIRLNAEMLQEDVAEQSADARRMLEAVVREVDHLTEITDQYLRLVRLPEPKLERVDLAALVRDVALFLTPEMQRANVAFELALDALPPVPSDEGQLRQALFNLCRNAREAMPDGGKIHVSLTPAEAGFVRLALSDQGPGIPAHEREKIFDLFYTTKQHGTGLGLALTQQIIVAHGGRIQCREAAGSGTCFEIELPSEAHGVTQPAHATEAL